MLDMNDVPLNHIICLSLYIMDMFCIPSKLIITFPSFQNISVLYNDEKQKAEFIDPDPGWSRVV